MTVARAASMAAAVVAAAALTLSTASCGSAVRTPGQVAPGPPTTATTPATPSPPGAPTTAAVPSTSSTTAARPTPSSSTVAVPPLLHLGDSGPAVTSLQTRLNQLGYWVGPVSGRFGDATQQAVYAVQKASGLPADGVVGPLTTAALAIGTVPTPRSTGGRVIEVDLERDLVMFVDGGKLLYTLNTSTGGGYVYTSDGVTAVADTPRGHFSIFRQVDGMVVAPLGELWRPKYFYAGFALHGGSYVPPQPVSHGCVRVSNEAIDWIWSADLAPIGTALWVY